MRDAGDKQDIDHPVSGNMTLTFLNLQKNFVASGSPGIRLQKDGGGEKINYGYKKNKVKLRTGKSTTEMEFYQASPQWINSDTSRKLHSQPLVKTNLYEGGLSIWECTLDFLAYLVNSELSFKGKNILDLGCGQGFLGIRTLRDCAKIVVFQDLNDEVLRNHTIPNVVSNFHLMNGTKKDQQSRYKGRPDKNITDASTNIDGRFDFNKSVCDFKLNDCDDYETYTVKENSIMGYSEAKNEIKFYDHLNTMFISSSWTDFCNDDFENYICCSIDKKLKENLHDKARDGSRQSLDKGLEIEEKDGIFDLILSSETLYRKENYASILNILRRYLKVGGCAIIASKRYYFGFDSGSLIFMKFILDNDLILEKGKSNQINDADIKSRQNRYKLSAKILNSIEDDKSNIRDIIIVEKQITDNFN